MGVDVGSPWWHHALVNRRRFFRFLGFGALSVPYVSTFLKPTKPEIIPMIYRNCDMGEPIRCSSISGKMHLINRAWDHDARWCVDCGFHLDGVQELEGKKFPDVCDDRIGQWRRAYGENLFKTSPFEEFLKRNGQVCSSKNYMAP